MDGRGMRRRAVLGLVGGGVAATGGCLGLEGSGPSCAADGVEMVFESQLRGWYVDYPATTGLFDTDGEDRESPARRLASLAEKAGYTAEYYYSEEIGRGNDDTWQIELYGQLDRAAVERLVARADMPKETDISEQTTSLSSGSELRLPWSPGLLDGRAKYLAENGSTVGVSIPSLGPTNSKTVTLTETPDEETVSWLRSVLSGRGIFRVEYLNVPDDDNPLTEHEFSNYVAPEQQGDNGSFTGGARIRADGTVVVDLYTEAFLRTLWRPQRENNLWMLDEARIGVSLDGRRIAERTLRAPERDYVEAYDAFIKNDDEDAEEPAAPPLVLDSLDARTALRTATLLNHAEDATFGVEVRNCGTD